MSDDDGDDFGPSLPEEDLLAASPSPHNDNQIAPSQMAPNISSPPSGEGLVGSCSKRPREENLILGAIEHVLPTGPSEGAAKLPVLLLSTQFDRAFDHGSPVVGIAHVPWSSGSIVLTLDADDRLWWWVKLPHHGLFLAKRTQLGEEAANQQSRWILLQSGSLDDPKLGCSTVVAIDVARGHVRVVSPELLELGPRIVLPAEIAALLSHSCDDPPNKRQAAHLRQSLHRTGGLLLVVAHPDEPKASFFRFSASGVSSMDSGSSFWSVGTGTMHPVAWMSTHEPSGLLIVVDAMGIVDYVMVDESADNIASTTQTSWRLVRGTEEFAAKGRAHKSNASTKQPSSVPNWVKHIAFPTRAKTGFFSVFREGQVPVGLSVGERSFVTCAVGNDGHIVHRVHHVASGKVMGSLQRAHGVGVLHHQRCCEATHVVSRFPSHTEDRQKGGVDGEDVWSWCTPGDGSGTCRITLGNAAVGGDAGTGGTGWTLHGPGSCDAPLQPVACVEGHSIPVTQQLRNMVARSPFGSGLGSEAVNTLLGASAAVAKRDMASTATQERMLLCIEGKRLVVFSTERDDSAGDQQCREFLCSEISERLGLQVLQKAEPALPHSAAQVLTTGGEEPVFASIMVTGHDQALRFRLLPFVAPMAVSNFRLLAEEGFYRGLAFHRVIKGFMIQGGCPKGDGTGSKCVLPLEEQISGGFRDELITLSVHADPTGGIRDLKPLKDMTQKYLLCMANSGPNTNGSQFFITTAATPWLAGHHTVFGVLASLHLTDEDAMKNLLHQLESVEVDRDARPINALTIADVVLESNESTR